MSTALRSLALVAATCAAVVAAPAPLAGAQPATHDVTATLAAQTVLLQADQPASVLLDVTGTFPEDTEVAVVVHNRITAGREQLRQAASGDVPTAPFRVLVTPLAAVPRDAAGRLSITIPTTSKRGSATGTEIPLRTPGIYPVELVLRAGDRNDELAKVVTFLVRLPDQPIENPLRVAIVLPLTGPPSLRADSTTAIDAGVRARLQAIVDLFGAVPGVPLSVKIEPELLDGLGRTGLPTDEELRSRLVTVLAGHQPLTGTYVTMDTTAAVGGGLGDEAVAQLRRGEDVLTEQIGPGAAVRSIWTASGALDEPAVVFLRDLGFRQLLVPPGTLEPISGRPGETRPARLRATESDRPLTVAAADADLSGAFGAHEQPVREAYLWLTELAYLALQPADNVNGPQGVVVLPSQWAPDTAFLGTVLAGLQANPLVVPTTAAQYFEQVLPARAKNGQAIVRSPAPATPEDLRSFGGELARVRRSLTSYGSMLPATSALPARLERLLQVAPSSELDAAGRQAYLDAVQDDLDDLRRSVDPVPARSITMAGRSSELPITITSRAKEPLLVKVRLTSSKLQFPDGNELVVTVNGGVTQARLGVEARTSGTFPVTVDLLTPDGGEKLAPSTQLTVRSTGLSGLGLALSVGALLVLALWWARHVHRSRRRKRAVVASQRHPSTLTAGPAN